MSTPPGPAGHERETDRAALDELERAFAERAEGAVAPVPAPQRSHAGSGDAPVTPPSDRQVDAVSVPADLPSVDEIQSMGDQLPTVVPPSVAEPPPSPAAPRIIRIDDYSGSVAIENEPIEQTPIGYEPDEDMAERPSPPSGDAADDAAAAVVPIVAIDDEGLPDAVYIEGSLDRSGSRSIVIIEDDDADDAFVPESGRDVRRGIEPRMRERRVAVKRAQGRRRLKWVAIVASIVAVVVGTLAVLGSPLFAIKADQVVLTGNVYADPERVQSVVDDLVGTPVLLADTQGAERELEAIPWVAAARVRTDFPHGVTIEIREREAMATYRGPDLRFRVLDREGRVLDVIENYPLAYVLLEGPDPVDLEPGEFAPRGYAAASELAKNLTGSVRGDVRSIEVTADGSRLVMHLDGDVDVRFGEARDLFAKLVRLETVLSAGGGEGPRVIDVSTSEVTL